jgi:anti-anti-sigma factor
MLTAVASAVGDGTGATRLRVRSGRPTIEVDGPIDVLNAAYVEALVLRGTNGNGTVVDIDLRQVPFVAAAGLSVFARCAPRVRLLHPSDLTKRVLELTGLTATMTIVESRS